MTTDLRTVSDAEFASLADSAATDEGRPMLSDADIVARIRTCLSRQAQIDATTVDMTAKHGIVILHGGVRCWSEWQLVERVAWSTPSVTDVDNHLVISYSTE